MKKSFLPAFLLLFLALGMFSCQQGAKKTTKEYPMFWTWLDYRPGMNFDSICQVISSDRTIKQYNDEIWHLEA